MPGPVILHGASLKNSAAGKQGPMLGPECSDSGLPVLGACASATPSPGAVLLASSGRGSGADVDENPT